MKRLIPAVFLLVALGLSACGGRLPDIGATITNPVTSIDIYRARNVYGATIELAVKWRRYCFARPYKSLMADPVAKPICTNRRERLRNIQVADDKAFDALTKAEVFVRNNPTLSVSTVVNEAWAAVSLFQGLIPALPVGAQ